MATGRCPKCQSEVELENAPDGVAGTCKNCGQKIFMAELGAQRLPLPPPGLVVVPHDQMPTTTETILISVGIIFEMAAAAAAVVALVCALGRSSATVVCLILAGGLCVYGFILLFMGHILRYLRTITNSLASFRARPLGKELNE